MIGVVTPSPFLSVVVPCRGDANVLPACLNALSRQACSFTFEVIVVDSGGEPGLDKLLSTLPCGRLVKSRTGLLPGAARNLGAKSAVGELIAFTDADCEPAVDWLTRTAEALAHDTKVAGGVVGHVRPLHPVEAADNIMQFIDFLPRRRASATDNLAGCNLAIRRRDFMSLGGFREDLIVGEDTLLIEEAARRWPERVRFEPHMVVRHKGRHTLDEFWKHQRRFGYYRAILDSRLTPGLKRMAPSIPFAAYFCARRFCYFSLRTLQWDPYGLPRFLLLSPLLAFGLAGYGAGFLSGRRDKVEGPDV